jgi:hypothetical protein
MTMPGRAIRIFLTDGTPTGLRVVELGLSTIKALYVPRGSLASFASRPEARKSGVYVLLGPDPDVPTRSRVYVGEADEVVSRVKAHDADPTKEFWDRVVVFVSKDENLTKAHVRFIEGKLVSLALQAKRAAVENKTTPLGGALPESDTAEMEEFVEQAKLLLAVLGANVFETAPATPTSSAMEPEPALELETSGDGFHATCRVVSGQFVVLKDSVAKTTEANTMPNGAKTRRKELKESGILEPREEGLVFTQDYPFPSASTAATVVAGCNVSGNTYWRLGSGQTLGEWQEQHIGSNNEDPA